MMPADPARPKLWRFLGIGAEFFSPILGGAVAGYYLDEHFRTEPWIVVTGVLLGVFLGFYRLFVELRNFQKSLEP
jgi:ATP synthase protein I